MESHHLMAKLSEASLVFCNEIDKDSITTLALGAFDGIHLGHKALIDKLDDNGAILAIESYNLDLTPSCIRSIFTDKKLIILPLDNICNMLPNEFITFLKNEFKNLKKLIVGYDFCFGKNRSAKADDLIQLFDGEVVIVDEIKANDISIHSSYIRELIRTGKIVEANRLLGHQYMIRGEPISGQGIGMRRLYPTLNLEVRKFLLPKEGVYASLCSFNGSTYKSVTFLGHRVSTDGSYAVETHIIDSGADFGNIKSVDIYFVELIRNNKKFDDLDALKNAIKNDINYAKRSLDERVYS